MKIGKFAKFLLLLLIGGLIFVSGFYFGESQKVIINPAEEVDLRLFSEVYHILEENFPGFEDIPEDEIAYGVVKGMIEVLDDPHTSFFDPEKSKIFLEDVSGQFEGIGVEIGVRDGRLQVISPLRGTPAYRAGVKSQDIIISIDGEPTDDLSLDEAVAKIRGPKGEEVVLGILRESEEKEISIVRDTIKIPSIEWELVDNDIAHIELLHFHENINNDFSRITREILNSPAKSIILDLRNNPGGIFTASINIAGRFIEPGSTVVIKTGSKKNNGNYDEIKTTGISPVFLDYPVVVLINEGSASAAEILAGALRDQRSTPIIGTNSFGKGSIQRMHHLHDGSTIKVTEEYFLTPSGNIINKEGISPDHEIEIKSEDSEEDIDTQLKKAIEIIKEK